MTTLVQTLVIEPAILRAQSNLALVLATMSRRGRKRSAQLLPLQLLEAQEHLRWVQSRIHAKSLARVVKKAIACLAKHPGMPPWRRQMQKKPKKTRQFRLRQWKPVIQTLIWTETLVRAAAESEEADCNPTSDIHYLCQKALSSARHLRRQACRKLLGPRRHAYSPPRHLLKR